MCYWLKVVIAGTVLSALLVAAVIGIGLALRQLPDPIRLRVLLAAACLALVAGMSALIHIWFRTH